MFDLSRDGYTFDGWYNNKFGEGKNYNNSTIIDSESEYPSALYAKWDSKKYNVTIKVNTEEGEEIQGGSVVEVAYGEVVDSSKVPTVTKQGSKATGYI